MIRPSRDTTTSLHDSHNETIISSPDWVNAIPCGYRMPARKTEEGVAGMSLQSPIIRTFPIVSTFNIVGIIVANPVTIAPCRIARSSSTTSTVVSVYGDGGNNILSNAASMVHKHSSRLANMPSNLSKSSICVFFFVLRHRVFFMHQTSVVKTFVHRFGRIYHENFFGGAKITTRKKKCPESRSRTMAPLRSNSSQE